MAQPNLGATRRCTKCEIEKDIADFRVRHDRLGQRGTICRPCRNESRRAACRKWYKNNAAAVLQSKRRNLMCNYGLTMDEFDALNRAQGGVCAICSNPPTKGKYLHVDHCHKTGEVRGLLCHKCNGGLGALGDTAESIERALAYLRKKVA